MSDVVFLIRFQSCLLLYPQKAFLVVLYDIFREDFVGKISKEVFNAEQLSLVLFRTLQSTKRNRLKLKNLECNNPLQYGYTLAVVESV